MSTRKSPAHRRCELMLERLSIHFGVKTPILEWSDYYGSQPITAFYDKSGKLDPYGTGMIKMGPFPTMALPHRWLKYSDILLHEFSHIVAHHRNKIAYSHSKAFTQILLEVVKFWYGNEDRYSWNLEYEYIAKYYAKTHPNYRKRFWLYKKIKSKDNYVGN